MRHTSRRHPPRALIRIFAITMFALVVGACAASTTVEQTWTSRSVYQDVPLKNVVTVFVSENETIRRSGERRLALDLVARGVEATPAYAILGDQTPRDF